MGFSAQPAAIFSRIGGALQTATQNLKFILVASKVTGIGNGALNGITPCLSLGDVYC